MQNLIPFVIGITVATTLFFTIGWWGFFVIFPWIGFAISLGIYLQGKLPKQKKNMGRKIAILMVMPILLLFVPVINNVYFEAA
ncbi:MAG: hypothetical protein K9L17_10350 [Clostridiales bacterium]|nr:hypothetical protein [Clostridiales bacterium]MCF8023082.1 hypothetical protein [Clostridiales bacterium]